MKKQDETEVLQAWQEAVQAEVKTRPWLAALFLQKGNQLFARFVDFYGRLTAVSSQTRRRLAVGLGTAALMLALSSTPAHAATITVTPGAAGINVGDGCSLVEAIINANNDALTHAECAQGSGADTIVLAGGTYSYTILHGTDSALPNITSPITIEANGATIQRTGGANMRIIRVNANGILTLNDATITGGAGVSFGGGIFNAGGTLTLNNSTVSGNMSSVGGGINNAGTTTLNNSTVSGNTASSGGGGGIVNFSADGNCTDPPTLIVNNSTVSGNTATSQGGGIYNLNGVAEIIHSTITGNTAPANLGAGVRSYNDNVTCTRVGGSIIAGNLTGGDVAANTTTQRFFSLGHNLIGTAAGPNVNFAQEFTATGDITNNVAPGLGPLANNGGPTLTHALVSGSPAIDLAPAANCNGAPINGVDQRGVARSIDGNLDGTAACDAGAVEQEVPEVCGVATATDYTLAGATLNIANLGTNLDCFQVALINKNHPDATNSGSNDALETGRFWRIHALQSDVSTPATTDYNVSLTLPFAGANNNSRVCKWLDGVGPGFGWDCDNSTTSNMANTSVTRTGISSFSDWAVGDNVGPTAVTNLSTQTNTPTQAPLIPVLATLLTLLSGAWLWLRRQTT